jgi:coatomer subunit beta
MAANMYARSIFGENALANLSIEKPFNKPDAPVTGHIRIRAKSQVSNGILCVVTYHF